MCAGQVRLYVLRADDVTDEAAVKKKTRSTLYGTTPNECLLFLIQGGAIPMRTVHHTLRPMMWARYIFLAKDP